MFTLRSVLDTHDEVWPQPYDHLYVSRCSGRSVVKDPDVYADASLAPQFDREPAVEPEDLEPLQTDEVVIEELQEPAARLYDAGKEIPDQSTDPDDLSEVDMNRPLRVTLGKELEYAPTFMEFIRC